MCHLGPTRPGLKIIRVEKEAMGKGIAIKAQAQKPVKYLGIAGQLF